MGQREEAKRRRLEAHQAKEKLNTERKFRREQKKLERICKIKELPERKARSGSAKGRHCKSHTFIKKEKTHSTPLRLPLSISKFNMMKEREQI